MLTTPLVLLGALLTTSSALQLQTPEKLKPAPPKPDAPADPAPGVIRYTAADAPEWRRGAPRREIDRNVLHPYFRIGHVDDQVFEEQWTRLQENLDRVKPKETEVVRSRAEGAAALIQVGVAAALAGAVLPPLALAALPLVPPLIAQRKRLWRRSVLASDRDHRADFEATTMAYRAGQRVLVGRLEHAQRERAARPPVAEAKTIVVTMATGQEGRAIVRELATTASLGVGKVRALVRDPTSAKARELLINDKVELVKCDSLDVDALADALRGADAAYLCTTLNKASAGTWAMSWDGGAYEVDQGRAMAAAWEALGDEAPRQLVYGTVPLRKWAPGYVVEPPIHYAAKWEIEKILLNAGVPLTCLRKCPYMENFTKLTKKAPGTPEGEWPAGTYYVRALTPPEFEYNVLDPRDIGPWASLVFAHPDILAGESLSIASDSLTGAEMAEQADGLFGEGVRWAYAEQPRWLFEALAFFEPTFVYISGLQRWTSDGGLYDLTRADVDRLRALHDGTRWRDFLKRDGLSQFTATMADLLPDAAKGL